VSTPSVVEQRRLKYAATINDEALAEDTEPDYELQYVDIGNVDSSGSIHEIATYHFADAPSRARRQVRDGDVIISTVRTYLQAIAPIQQPPGNLIVSTGFAVVRPRASVFDAGFCKYALREPAFLAEVEMRSVGVSYPAINSSDLGDIQIHLPALQHQRAIANYLDRETARLDRLVAAKERVLGLVAEKRRALITHAVTRGLDPRASLRDSCIPWLGEIPAHWDTRRVAWLFRDRDERGQPDLPLLEVSINTGVVLREFSDDRIESTAADFNTYKVARKGDIVFNKMRMWQGAVGVAPEDGLVSPDYTVAAPSGALSSDYAGQLFRTEKFSAECARRSHGIVWDRLRLYWEGFRDIEIPLPPLDEQHTILAHILRETTKLDALRTATERTIALLKERRAALIAAAVTGQIEVEGTA
jgi:type I restriction enzyme, S subunit